MPKDMFTGQCDGLVRRAEWILADKAVFNRVKLGVDEIFHADGCDVWIVLGAAREYLT
jgi:hypothetical protein